MFAKVFEQIFSSSIADDYLVRLVFEDFLVLADKTGAVDMTAQAIARRTNVPLDIVQRGIDQLSSPDTESRTPQHEGRRIVLLDSHRNWGWHIVNYEAYRNLRDEDGRREYMRSYMRDKRKHDVNCRKQCKPPLAKAEAEAEAEETPLSPEDVSRAVRETLGLSGKWLTGILDDVCRAELKSGKDPDKVRDDLVSAYRNYEANGPTEFRQGAEKFFGERTWAKWIESAKADKYWRPSE